VQRGRTVDLWSVDVGLLLKEPLDRGRIAIHDGVGDVALAGGCSHRGDAQQHRHRATKSEV
jgi:hypothetical protein